MRAIVPWRRKGQTPMTAETSTVVAVGVGLAGLGWRAFGTLDAHIRAQGRTLGRASWGKVDTPDRGVRDTGDRERSLRTRREQAPDEAGSGRGPSAGR